MTQYGLPKIRILDMKPATQVLIENVNALRARFPELKPMATLAKKAGVGKGTVERMTKEGNCELVSLDAVARAFGLQPWQLLVPELDPDNPPQMGKFTPEMERTLQKAKQMARELVTLSAGAGDS